MADSPFGRGGVDRPEEPEEPPEPPRPDPPREMESVVDRIVGEDPMVGDRPRAGEWVEAPARSYGHDVNARYEAWVRAETRGPAGHEYRVIDADGSPVYFDARTVEVRDGEPVEVLLDAKGRYEQFLDADGKWHGFFGDQPGTGLERMLDDARRQVDAAGGRPVQWWCLEERAAVGFNRAFAFNQDLRGRIEAVHRPLPSEREEQP